MNYQPINAAASPEVQINENFDTINWASVYGKRQPVTSALTWGYYGGRWGGFAISDGTLTLSDAATNYLVVQRSSGAHSTSTAATNWNDVANYARVYKLTTAGGLVTATEDHRAGTYGMLGATLTAGRQSVWIPADRIKPSASGGCAALATIATAANQPDVTSLDFDPTTQEYAQFALGMPKRWNEGTVTFRAVWSHAATATNFGVMWNLAGVAVSDGDLMAQAYGTAATSTDIGGTTNPLYLSPESSAITLAGTPATDDVVFFRASRVATDGSDTMTIDARLHGIVFYIVTDAENDA